MTADSTPTSANLAVLALGSNLGDRASTLASALRGVGFAALLALLYGMLFGLLGAEDYALLMGSVLVFGVLAGVMVLTRKLDWYGVGRLPLASSASPASDL